MDGSTVGWALPAIFSALTSILVGIVLMFLRGVSADVRELQQKTERLEHNYESKLDIMAKEFRDQGRQQQDQVSTLREKIASMQEQLYALLRRPGGDSGESRK